MSLPTISRVVILGCCLWSACGAMQRAPSRPRIPGASPPALAVLISVDQLRADMPHAVYDRLGEGGFRRLYEQGVVYGAAHYAHSATETAVGHATLATGALPRDHGIVGNEWTENGTRVYAVGDVTEPMIGASGPGRSPHRLLAETIGDVLAERSPRALIRSISEKDRSAILLGGRRAKAYWLDEGAGTFVSSRYYGERLPRWVQAFGDDRPAERYRKKGWQLLHDEATYRARDDHPWERGCALLGCRFPHVFDDDTGARFIRVLKHTPLADDLTLRFVKALLESEPLGRDDVPDLLAISFSSTDYVGHAFGPESREAEDNLLRLDRTLAELFALLDERVGVDRYFVVLSADHGACEAPEFFAQQGLDAGRIDPVALTQALDAGLRVQLGIGVDLVRDFVNPTVVLNEQRIASLSLPLAKVERAAAEIARSLPGVHAAYARSDLLAEAGEGGDDPFRERIVNSTHPDRSGNVYIVPKEHWLLTTDPVQPTAMHGTPWPYDAHVPILVWGTRARAQVVQRPVDPRDVAPTIATLLGLRAPRQASGKPLIEVVAPSAPPSVPAPPTSASQSRSPSTRPVR